MKSRFGAYSIVNLKRQGESEGENLIQDMKKEANLPLRKPAPWITDENVLPVVLGVLWVWVFCGFLF